jgi:long-chain acyl-CoA synthetase
MMETIWMKNWPADMPRTLTLLSGEIPLHQHLRLRAMEMPDKTAIVYYGREISYSELNTTSDLFAHYLATNGVKKGDRVAIFMGNCPQYVVAHFGIQKIGAIVCPCSPLFKELELEYELNDCGAEILVAWNHFMPTISKIKDQTGLRKIITTHLDDFLPDNPALPLPEAMKNLPRHESGDIEDFLSIVTGPLSEPPTVDIDMRNDISLLQYTGGTTGMPKGCMLTSYAALFKTATVCTFAELDENDVCLVTMPIFHIAGMLAGMNSCIYSGATQVLMTLFDPETAMKAIENYGVSFWYSAVPMNVAIMAHPELESHDLTSLKLCLTSSFGIQLSEEIAADWARRTGGGVLVEGAYGLSETHTADTFMPRQMIRYDTVGIPGPDQEFRIVDIEDRNREMPIGEQGEIVLKNPAVFKGYWNQPEASADTLKDGWVYTGDIGKFDDEGFLYLLGRLKEMIKVSGFSVFPEEVENFLNRHPAVAQSAVIGVPDPTKGEVVKAFIVLKAGHSTSADEIRSWARDAMSSYKCPVHVEFRESLPTLGTGKLLRRALRTVI